MTEANHSAPRQAQDSLTSQLARLTVLAVGAGLYDAADWITAQVEHRSSPCIAVPNDREGGHA